MINAIAGGGTLLTFPTLLFFGTNSIVANATSTLALVLGTGGSLYGFRHQIGLVGPWLVRFVPVSLAGGWIGSFLLTRTSEGVFSRLVPFLILFATLVFMGQSAFARFAREKSSESAGKRTLGLAMAFQFAVSVYGGFFGAGIGILMLASLGFLGLRDIHQTNALKNVLGSLINCVAAVWFVVSGLIDWPKAGVMTGGALVGYFLGAHYSQRITQKRLRQMIIGIGMGISILMFYRGMRD